MASGKGRKGKVVAVFQKMAEVYMTWPGDFIDRVICGDCLEVMKEIPDRGVDLIVTSIPFNAGKDYGGQYDDNLPVDVYLENVKRWCEEMVRIAGIALYIFTSTRYMAEVKDCLPGFCQWLFYHRRNIVGTSLKFPWIPTITPIAMAWKDGRKPMVNSSHAKTTFDLISATGPQRSYSGDLKRCHVTQDPLDVVKPLIGRTPGDIILDPFAGSGTTLVAAKQLGRRYIGIEINPDYCAIAEDRLRQRELF
ncbi:MAG: site-specific DNA-methyltransferase [Candidatus Zixiibacteriota bacterium]|nr:MAG: site-specific DNA-methyltransferase [candidate division Zixibacteria bacterium]